VTEDTEQVKKLRLITNSGVLDCRDALREADGSIDKAVEILRKKGLAKAEKKVTRETDQGRVESYVHLGGRIGVLLEIKCETDFVARNETFRSLARDLCMHIAAMKPISVSKESVPQEILEREKSIYRESDELKSKPENVREKIVEGRLKKFYADSVFLEQPFVKDEKMTVGEYIKQNIAKFGENIAVTRFIRFELGEECK
jgi:elongation factor Ts